MFTSNRHFKSISRACLILVYVSFFSVQLNLHLGRTPAVCFFTGDFVSQHTGNFHKTLSTADHKDSKPTGFRLNKRFHPSYLIAPDVLQDLVKYSFSIETKLLNETQPLTNFSFNAPSLRGPPAIV